MILVISGTNRTGSRSLQIAKQLHGFLEEHPQSPATKLIDLADLPQSVFQGGAYWEKPEDFQPFAQDVLYSDGILTVVPEYNGSFPGILKYFIDLLPFPESFENRPVSFVGVSAGQWGSLRAVEQLQHVFGYRNAHVYPRRTFLPGINSILDDDGNFTQEDIAERLKKQVNGFVDFCQRIKSDS